MSGKAAPNRRVAAIQAKKKRKNPKRKGMLLLEVLIHLLNRHAVTVPIFYMAIQDFFRECTLYNVPVVPVFLLLFLSAS
jgi:hypothetical protein